MRMRIGTVGMLLLLLLCATAPVSAQSGQELYQQGLGMEQLGEYEDALEIYERIVQGFPGNRTLVARAKLQMIECWVRLGSARAQELIDEVIDDYQDQPDVVARARQLAARTSRMTRLTDKDVLVLADFVNTTGDAVFDETLRQALAIQLEESPFLKILDDEQARRQMGLMGRKPDERITNPVAREICVREGEKAMISGLIASVGTRYAVTVQASRCANGETLARAQTEAPDKEHVLAAVAGVAREIRLRLGESLTSIQKLARPDEVTTTSLEAFQAFTQGVERFRQGLWSDAALHLERATQIDPEFASAFHMLGNAYNNVRDRLRSSENFRKAFDLADGVSERERLTIVGSYHMHVTGETDPAIAAFESVAALYPRDARAHNQLGLIFGTLGQVERARLEFEESIRLEPHAVSSVTNLAIYLGLADKFDDLRAVLEQAFERGLDVPSLHGMRLELAYLEGDAEAIERETLWFSGRPEEFIPLIVQAVHVRALGQFRRAAALLHEADELRRLRGVNERFVMLNAAQGGGFRPGRGGFPDARGEQAASLLDGRCSMPQQSDRDERAARIAAGPVEARLMFAVGLGICDPAAAQAIVDEAERERPGDTRLNNFFLPMARASIALGRDQPAAAVEALQPTTAHLTLPPLILARALVYSRAGMPEEASAQFQMVLDRRFFYPAHSGAYVGLARAAAEAGDTAGARRAYEDFFEFWKDADADAPLLVQAQQEYAALP